MRTRPQRTLPRPVPRRTVVSGVAGVVVALLAATAGWVVGWPPSGPAGSGVLTWAPPAALAAGATAPDPPAAAEGAAAAAAPSWRSAACSGGSLVVVAHTDDDLLFINPEQQRAITAGTCLHTVFVTAGDAGQDAGYWQARERGAQAAYAFMAGVADDWEETSISSRGLRLLRLKADWRVNLIFLRLPDGMQRGVGTRRSKGQSLKKLWNGDIASMDAVDGSNTYTRRQLVDTLAELMRLTRPTTIRTLDFVNSFKDTDHSDHHAVGYLTREASRAYAKQQKARPRLVAYQGYTIASRKENLSPGDAKAKLAAFDTYATYDYVGQNRRYIPRQYVLSTSP